MADSTTIAILIIVIINLILFIILFIMFTIVLARLNNLISKTDIIINELFRLFNTIFPPSTTSAASVTVTTKKSPKMFKLTR